MVIFVFASVVMCMCEEKYTSILYDHINRIGKNDPLVYERKSLT